MLAKMTGRVRGWFAGNYPENREEEQLHINPRGDQIMSQGLPERTELVRLGDSWQVSSSAGLAANIAAPSNSAGLSLWNGEPLTGKCYAIEAFGSTQEVIDAGSANTTAIFAMNNRVPVAAPTDSGLTIRSTCARIYDGRARIVAGLAVTNEGWFAHGPTSEMAAVAGANWKITEARVKGLYLVPPGGCFSVVAVQVAAPALQHFYFIRWFEVQILFKS